MLLLETAQLFFATFVMLEAKRKVTLSCYQILIKRGTEGLLGKMKLKVWQRKSKSISLEYFNSIVAFLFLFCLEIYAQVCVYMLHIQHAKHM